MPKVLLGTRTMFADESNLSVEYLYQADGYTPTDFQAFLGALEAFRQARRLGVATAGAGASSPTPRPSLEGAAGAGDLAVSTARRTSSAGPGAGCHVGLAMMDSTCRSSVSVNFSPVPENTLMPLS